MKAASFSTASSSAGRPIRRIASPTHSAYVGVVTSVPRQSKSTASNGPSMIGMLPDARVRRGVRRAARPPDCTPWTYS